MGSEPIGSGGPFLEYLQSLVGRYRSEVASKREHLSLLRWQMAEHHALDDRTTMPGHVTTSAIIVSPDHQQVLLVDHVAIGRWLQPGGHYEPASYFYQSALREVEIWKKRQPYNRRHDRQCRFRSESDTPVLTPNILEPEGQ